MIITKKFIEVGKSTETIHQLIRQDLTTLGPVGVCKTVAILLLQVGILGSNNLTKAVDMGIVGSGIQYCNKNYMIQHS